MRRPGLFLNTRLAAIVVAAAALILSMPASAACNEEDFATAVDKAGASLRAFNAEASPRLKQKLVQLKQKKGWPEEGYEERALETIQDERLATFDTEANELLSRIDELGRPATPATPDCQKLDELRSTGERLLTVMREKTAYTIEKLDQELGLAPAKPKPPAPQVADAPTAIAKPPAAASPKPWSTTTRPAPVEPAPPLPQVAAAPAMLPPEQGYTIDEIREASRSLFGTVSTGLASVIEHAFATSGRPTAYVLGNEGGGAFLAGLRYGQGTLYLRSGGSRKVYWHGPSVGGDIGAEGSRTLYLIYHLDTPDDLFRRLSGIDGTAYLVGGVGITFLKGGKVIMAPIRSGLGLRLGASIGYVRFTPRPTWNPF